MGKIIHVIRPGMKFNSWTVLRAPEYGVKYPKVLCRCVCGKEKMVGIYTLVKGKSKSCGCQQNHPQKTYPIGVGDHVGYWTIVNRRGNFFRCRCVCGTERLVQVYMLLSHRSLSCGCKRADNMTDDQLSGKKKGHAVMDAIHAAGLGPSYIGRKTNKNSGTGFTGVSWIPKIKKYRAYIMLDRKQIHLGSYTYIEDAIAARKAAEEKYFTDRQAAVDDIKQNFKGEKTVKKTIYMSEPLERLAEKTQAADRRNGGFSRRLGEIVDRYDIIMSMTDLPEFTDAETEILSEIVCGSVIDARKIRGLHLDVIDVASETEAHKAKLRRKIESLSPAQRIKLIENLGQ